LGIPVVLVVDAKSAAYSMAALLSGFIHFRNDISIAGVIFNKVGSARHAEMLRQVCDDLHIECLGCLPKTAELEQGSRYLGLDFSNLSNNSHTIPAEQKLTEILEKSLDLSRFFTLGVYSGQTPSLLRLNSQFTRSKLRVLSARNSEAFSFIYQETIDQFEFVSFFNPETEVPDFSGIDMLYLPGGYPEKHLQALVSNEACRKAIRQFAEQGGRIVAECGGMMYLCKSIITDSGEYPMCNVLPYSITARTADRKLSLGYRRFMLDGKEYRGHEFHYTQFANEVPTSDCQVFNAKGEPVPTPVFHYKNVLASYTHLYQFPYK
jgi:cobyrinic acid a,c-diamide synthase